MIVQLLANTVVIGLLILVLPGFQLHAKHKLLALLWLAAVFEVLTALVRPALEFLLLPYVLQSLGLVMVVINAVLLLLLSLTSTLVIKSVWALLAGAVLTAPLGFVLDNLLGLTPPVLLDAPAPVEHEEGAIRIRTVSERLRVMQLYGVLSRYGVDIAFDRPPVGGFRRWMQQWLWQPAVRIQPLPIQVKIRLLLQDLGPTFVKLGQMVSSQGRALPFEWEEELEKLQSDVRPFPYESARAIVTDSLGAPPETLYESFNPTPLAAASLAQVHEATTHDGRRVAVKVQRPNIRHQLRSDVRILARGAALLERRVAWADDVDLTGVVREFGTTLLRELDYSIESYNARRLERALAPIEKVHVPVVEPKLSSDRVLTLEFIEGVKSTDTTEIDAAGLDRHELARNLVRAAVQTAMIEGFFHGDPHPGNVVIELTDGRMTFLDAGMVGQLSLQKRTRLARLLLAFRDRDVSSLATAFRSLSTPFRDADASAYQRRFEQRIGPLIDPPPGQFLSLQKLVSETLDVLRESGYRLDSEFTLAIKALAQAQAITAALVPEAGLSEFAEMGGAALQEFVPRAIGPDVVLAEARKQAMFVAGEIVQRLPVVQEAALTWLDRLQKDPTSVSADRSDLDQSADRFERTGRLLALAIALTGMLIGSALAAAIDTGTSTLRIGLKNAAQILYVVAMAVAVCFVAILLWRLVRPQHRKRRRRSDIE
jgi:ubiquinone biosynthesis protein